MTSAWTELVLVASGSVDSLANPIEFLSGAFKILSFVVFRMSRKTMKTLLSWPLMNPLRAA